MNQTELIELLQEFGHPDAIVCFESAEECNAAEGIYLKSGALGKKTVMLFSQDADADVDDDDTHVPRSWFITHIQARLHSYDLDMIKEAVADLEKKSQRLLNDQGIPL